MVVDAESESLGDFFGTQKWVLRAMGLSLSPNLTVLYRAGSYTILFLLIMYNCFMIPQLFKYNENFDDTIDVWLFGTGYIVVMVKVMTIFLNRKKINNILNTLQTGVFSPNSIRVGEKERTLLEDCINFTKKLTIISTCVGVGTMLICVGGSYAIYMNTGTRNLPFGMIASLINNFNYETTLLYQSVVYGIGVEAFMVVDVVYSSVLAHICVQCKILQNVIRQSTTISRALMTQEEGSPSTEDTEIPYKYLLQTLKEIVGRHMAILEVAEDIEDVFNIPTLGVFSVLSVCFCLIMYQGSQYPFLNLNFIRDFLILTTAMLTLTANSYWGSEVLFGSLGVADACYEVDFPGTDVRFQKALVMIIRRSQKPIKLTVGKFATLSLVTMVGVFRLSYSYFMLLRKVNTVLEV